MFYIMLYLVITPFSFTIKLNIHHLYLFIANNFFVVVAIVVIMLTPVRRFAVRKT